MTNLNPYYFKELLKNDIIFTLHAKELKSGLKQKEYAFVGHSVCHGTQISTSIKCIYMSCYPYILVRMCPGTYLSQSHMCHPICHGILLPVAEPSRAKYSSPYLHHRTLLPPCFKGLVQCLTDLKVHMHKGRLFR